jgi:AraC-like DNA-binding protein
VAYLVGFEDQSYFTKVFKKHFGFLPSEKDKIKAFYKQ